MGGYGFRFRCLFTVEFVLDGEIGLGGCGVYGC